MSKARTLADFISDGSEFADGTISVAEVSGAAPLASPSFTGNLTTGGNITLDEASASAHGEATKLLTASGNGYYQDLRISANDYDFRYGPSAWNSAYSALQISSTGSVVFNEGGLDADTRFEGTSDSNVLAVNAGNNRVGVGTNGGLHKLSVLHTGTALGGVAHFSIGSAASAYATTVFRVDDVDNNFAIDQNYASQDRNRIFIKRSNGYVGIGGVTSPSAMLHVESNGSGNYAAIVKHTQATNPNGLLIDYSGSGYIDTYALRIQNTDGVIWDQRGTGSLLHYAQDGATVRFNTGAANVDFQVKSDSHSNAFFVDASTGGIRSDVYDFTINNQDDGPALTLMSGRDYNSLLMGAAENYGSNNSSSNKWSWNWRGRNAGSSSHYNFLYDEIGNQEYFRVQADASQKAVVVNDGSHDHDFRVESGSFSSAFIVDAGANLVGFADVGTAPWAQTSGQGVMTYRLTEGSMALSNNGTNGYAGLYINKFNAASDSRAISFYREGGTEGHIRLDATQGVKYGTSTNGGVTSTTELNRLGITFDGGSNYLDDYEEGTWDARPSTSSSSVVPLSGWNIGAYSGSYVKIGRLVICQFYFDWTNTNTNSGTVYLKLPFQVNGTTNQWSGNGIETSQVSFPSGATQITVRPENIQAHATFKGCGNQLSRVDLQFNHLGGYGAGYTLGSFVYMTTA